MSHAETFFAAAARICREISYVSFASSLAAQADEMVSRRRVCVGDRVNVETRFCMPNHMDAAA
jgi:hypothetical protein